MLSKKNKKKELNINPTKTSVKSKVGVSMPYNLRLIIVVGILLVIGAYMVFSASYVGVDNSPPWYYLIRHIIFMFIGIFMGLIFFNFGRIKKKGPFIYGFMVVSLLLLGLAYLFGNTGGGSRRWISVGFINIQPSELIKPALILLIAHLLTRSKKPQIWLSLISAFIIFALVAVENFSSALIIILPVFVMLIVNGLKKKHYFAVLSIAAVGIPYFIFTKTYRLIRLLNFSHVWLNPLSADYQAKQSLYALADGSIVGVGITNSKQKFFLLPEHHTDFIFAIVGEELGFVGAVALILLLFVLSFIIIQIALETENRFGKLAILGFGALFIFQTLLNLSVVVALVPVTGVTLPFISYGGSSLISFLMIIGFILGASMPRKRKINENKKS
ncbi:MAG: FtsW/RodA/SpoVE family cell cycle protein [Firmicutes bacterium]|nr:FtsW/RodA/SpoVE family cell cycle protein [Bacillota bacterium]